MCEHPPPLEVFKKLFLHPWYPLPDLRPHIMLTYPCLTLETRTPHTVLHASTRAQIACDRSETRSVQIAARHVRAVGAASSAREIQGRPFHCADSSSQLVASYNESHRQEWFKRFGLHHALASQSWPALLRLCHEPGANLRDHHQLLRLSRVRSLRGPELRNCVEHFARVLKNHSESVRERRRCLHDVHFELRRLELGCKLVCKPGGKLLMRPT